MLEGKLSIGYFSKEILQTLSQLGKNALFTSFCTDVLNINPFFSKHSVLKSYLIKTELRRRRQFTHVTILNLKDHTLLSKRATRPGCQFH